MPGKGSGNNRHQQIDFITVYLNVAKAEKSVEIFNSLILLNMDPLNWPFYFPFLRRLVPKKEFFSVLFTNVV